MKNKKLIGEALGKNNDRMTEQKTNKTCLKWDSCTQQDWNKHKAWPEPPKH